MSAPRPVKADFITSIVFVALGTATAVRSYNMPRLEELGVNPYTAPGLVPGLLGTIIALLGLMLLVRSARAGGWRLAPTARNTFQAFLGDSTRRLVLALFLTIGYAAGLMGRLPFWLATLVFIFLFITLFEWAPGQDAPTRWRIAIIAMIQAILVAAAVTAVFQYVFLVRLP